MAGLGKLAQAIQLDDQPAQPTAGHHRSNSLLGKGMLSGLCSYICGKPNTKPRCSFARLPIWTRGYLVQQIRPWAWPIWSPVVPLVCSGPFGRREAALLGWATPPLDDQPCTWCGQDYDSPSMILCDQCNHCYHKDCTA